MSDHLKRNKRLVRGILVAMTGLLPALAMAAPSQLPLLSRDGTTGKPNVMFTLDDSGSMEWSFMPDSAYGITPSGASSYGMGWDPAESNGWPFPRDRYVATTVDLFAARFRSSSFNRVYYNPAVRYRPWAYTDGTLMPNASPTAAPIDPDSLGRGSANLVGTRNENRNWCISASCANRTLEYTPATYFQYNGGATNVLANYTRVRIQDFATFVRPDSRADCALTAPADGTRTCTRAQEYQNFANWFTYYRKRIYLAIGASSQAFSEQGEGLRVGYGRINKGSSSIDNVSTSTVERGVRTFSGTDRSDFFSWLHGQYPVGSTPLRPAMDAVGRYFERADNRGPWGEYPGTNDTTAHLACRKSYHILMTDGYWNGGTAPTSGARANVDNSNGPLITGPGAKSYRYLPIRPFKDDTSNTLADIAMYYWNRDLRPDLDNLVRPDVDNPAFWQQLTQFTVGLGVGGTLNPDVDLPDLESGAKVWPAAAADSPSAVDDLWHAAVNSRGKYLSASDPAEFATALSAILQNIAVRETAEGGSAVSSITLEAGSTKFIPTYKSVTWSGDVLAKALDASGLPIGDLWSAAKKLPAHGSRNLFAGLGGSAGSSPLNWASLSPAQIALIGPLGSDNLIKFLRGDRSQEGITYRVRDASSVLGDMVNSTPLLIGGILDEQYQFLPAGTPGKDTYQTYVQAKRGRADVLFVGANDGMLHGFDGATGVEVFGFMPNAVLNKVAQLSQPAYEHKFYVDGPLVEADVYLGGWKNYLLGSTGAGARSVFAIDVSNASSMSAGNVKWELTDTDLGHVLSPLSAGLAKDGTWVAVFGNGVDSASGIGKLFVVNMSTGAIIRKIAVPGANNGLGGVRLVKDLNNVVVAAYAGDLLGRLWRFDMSAAGPGSWALGHGGNPLYTATSGGLGQPIIGVPEYVSHPKGGQLVLFGTGKLYEDADLLNTDPQTLYGIWDTAPGDRVSLASERVTSSALLVTQNFSGTVSVGGNEFDQSTSYTVDYATKRGWKLDLTLAPGQRAAYSPQLVRGYVLFSTLALQPASPQSCTNSGAVGYNILINALTGGQPTKPILDTNLDGNIDSSDALVSSYKTVADGNDIVMLGRGGVVVIQRALGQTTAQIQGRALERTWRQLMTIPR